jgi:hypothetical protein
MSAQKVLSADGRQRRKDLSLELDQIWKMEDKDIKEGDRNMAFFFAKANQRKRKNTIPCLEDGNDILTEEADMMKHAIDFYKNLFG